MVKITQPLPVNKLGEQCLIGVVLNNESAIEQIGFIEGKVFSVPLHKMLWDIIKSLSTVDKYMLFEAAKKEGINIRDNDSGLEGIDYLNECRRLAIDGLSVVTYAMEVYKAYIARNIIEKSIKQIEMAMNINPSTNINEVLETINDNAISIEILAEPINESPARFANDIIKEDIIPNTEKRRKGEIELIKTGLTLLDNKLYGGIERTRVLMVGAMEGEGKTECALSIAHYVMKQGYYVAWFSLEMPGSEVVQRIEQMNRNISVANFLAPQDMTEADYINFMYDLKSSDYRMIVDATPSVSPMYIRRSIRRLQNEGFNIGLAVVDYVGLQSVPLSIEKLGKLEMMKYINQTNKETARELKIVFLALEQFNKDMAKRRIKYPTKSDVQYRGTQATDIFAGIYRPSLHEEHVIDTNVVDLFISKNRQTQFDNERLRFWRKSKSGLYEDLVNVPPSNSL